MLRCNASVNLFLFWNEARLMGQDCLLFLGHSRGHLPEAKTGHALAYFLQYLLLPNQKSKQKQDFLLTSISPELLMSRSRQAMAKINTKIGIISTIFWKPTS